jgi:glycosyltransferase involved in cell wall biosynthesis
MMSMKVCYVSPEVFHWGVYGGFGYLTWMLGRKLAERGVDVSVVTQCRSGQREVEEVDGFTVYGYPSHSIGLASLSARRESMKYYRMADADIYHSQAISYNSYVAQAACPEKKHVLTFQDPYDRDEWNRIAKVEPKYGSIRHKLRVVAETRFLAKTCHRMDALYSQAHFLVKKSVDLYGLSVEPSFLPNPVPIPETITGKSETPLVCFLARWDPQKRVELFFQLAKDNPDIEFIAMGRSHDPEQDIRLRETYSDIHNLTLTGFVSEAEKQEILGHSWALINTSIREALPVSFLESLANETPVISRENPDDLISRYGYHVQSGEYQDGLDLLLDCDEWRHRGKDGRRHVQSVYDADKVADLHIREYERIIEASK